MTHLGLLGVGSQLAFTAACRPRGAGSGMPTDAAAPPGPAARPAFTAAEMVTLTAVCDRLLPRDQDPGAVDLGVPRYIERALGSPELASLRGFVSRVLPLLDRQSQARHGGKVFHEATPELQDSLLAAWQHGGGGDRRFFETMLTLTLEGAFGDPRYGGNRDGRGYSLIGFAPGPPMPKRGRGKAPG